MGLMGNKVETYRQGAGRYVLAFIKGQALLKPLFLLSFSRPCGNERAELERAQRKKQRNIHP